MSNLDRRDAYLDVPDGYDLDLVPCPVCNGTGRDADEDGEFKCTKCKGTGLVENENTGDA